MAAHRKLTIEQAETVAARAFAVLTGDEARLHGFLEITGLKPDTIRQAAAAPGFLAAVLDHVAADEPLLVEVARALSTTPERIMEARHTLSPSDFE